MMPALSTSAQRTRSVTSKPVPSGSLGGDSDFIGSGQFFVGVRTPTRGVMLGGAHRITSDRIDLEVHGVTGSLRPEGRAGRGLGYQRDLERSARQSGNGQA